jgi:hypothetical protein
MHLAAGKSSAEVVRCLVELGGVEQLRATDQHGWVPMHWAAAFNPSVGVVRYLLGRGCDRSPLAHDGRTPLQLAISENKEAVAAALIEAGAATAGVRLSASLQRVAANVSVASVASSYATDDLGAEVCATDSSWCTCQICFETFMSGGIGCANSHYVCGECFIPYIHVRCFLDIQSLSCVCEKLALMCCCLLLGRCVLSVILYPTNMLMSKDCVQVGGTCAVLQMIVALHHTQMGKSHALS